MGFFRSESGNSDDELPPSFLSDCCASEEPISRLEQLRNRRAVRVPSEPLLGQPQTLVTVRHINLGIVRRRFHPEDSVLSVYDWVGSLSNFPEYFTLRTTPTSIIYPEEKVSVVKEILSMEVEETEVALSKEDSNITLGSGKDTTLDDTIPESMFSPKFLGTPKNNVCIGDGSKFLEVLMEGDKISEDENDQTYFNRLEERRKQALKLLQFDKYIIVSKSNVNDELLQIYKDIDIMKYKLAASFDEHDATGDGVLRELYSLFWEQFFAQNCQGDTEVALTITQHMIPDDFYTVGRIITHEFLQCGVFPVRLAKASVHHALFNEVGESELLDSFCCIHPPKQREILNKALEGRRPFPRGQLLDLLEDFKVNQLPTPDNIHQIVIRVATTEFVSKPSLALMKLREGMGHFWNDIKREEINALYNLSKPIVRLVIERINATPTDMQEEAVFRWLKRFLFESGDRMCAAFVRFATGSDVLMPDQKIAVRFESVSTFALRPRSRTCFSVVIVPKNYRNYSELQDNFDHYLRDHTAWDLAD